MRTLAVEPPPVLDKEERRLKFINRNGENTPAFLGLALLGGFWALNLAKSFLSTGDVTELVVSSANGKPTQCES